MNSPLRKHWRSFFFATFGLAAGPSFAEGETSLDALLEPIRERHKVPALAAAMVREGRLVASGAAGVRRFGTPVRATLQDRWHIGSCTKSMTATLAAMLVEEGKIQWTTTVGEVFANTKMQPQWSAVTLEQLLTHRAGAPEDPPDDLWLEAWKRVGPPSEQRTAFVRGLLGTPPVSAPGTAFLYSNQGYAIAGAMLERVTQTPWESLLRQRLSGPLELKSVGFGAPASGENVDAPWGHIVRAGEMVPIPGGPHADNPPAIGPAGTVHCSIGDFARYAGWHARGARAGKTLLGDASFTRLHAPAAGGDYAMGWSVGPRKWAGGLALSHNGSNTMFFAVMWLAPEKDAAFVAATNIGGEAGAKACDEAVAAMIGKLLN